MMEAMEALHEDFARTPDGLRICFATSGDPAGEPLLLVMGLGQQLIAWPDALIDDLVARGFFVVRFDNRDSGRSSRAHVRPPTTGQLVARRFAREQYTLADMAGDAVAVLDRLEIDSVHVAGVSLGGMIAQTLAALHPERVRTLTSIMSTTGARGVGRIALSTMRLVLSAPPADADAAVERATAMMRHIGSRGFPFAEAELAERVRRAWERGDGRRAYQGSGRQIAAILKSGDRTEQLGRITAPTLVIHGDHDPMVHPSGGRATAAAIPGARLVTIEGMGHDLAPGLLGRLAELIAGHAGARTGVHA